MSFSIDLRSTVKTLEDEPLALGQAAVYLSRITRPGVSSAQYISHLKTISEDVKQRFRALLHAGAEDTAETRLAALKHTLSDKNGYVLCNDGTDPVQSCDITRVVDCAKGSDVILAILYIVAARSQGWGIEGVDFPGRFLCRLEQGGQRVLFDPSQGCKIMQAPDLRKILKAASGEQAELSAGYYEGVTDVDVLIALQNRIKNRQIECEDYEGALKSVEAMRVIDPQEYRLLLEAGVLYMRTDQHGKARPALEQYIEVAPTPRDRQEALAIMQHLRLDEE